MKYISSWTLPIGDDYRAAVAQFLKDGGTPPAGVKMLGRWHGTNGKGFMVGRNGDYIAMNNSEMRRHLLSLGYSREKRSPLSEVDQALHDIQFTKSVVYAGPLAGYSPGLREVCGNRILVTGAPKIIEPDPKVEWPVNRLKHRVEVWNFDPKPDDYLRGQKYNGIYVCSGVAVAAAFLEGFQVIRPAEGRRCVIVVPKPERPLRSKT